MKRSILTALVFAAAAIGFTPLAAEAQNVRVGYINSQRIMAQAPGTAEAQRAFEAEMQKFQGELEQMETELQTMQESFDRQQATLSQQARQQRQQEMQQRFMAYQQRRGELEETAQQRQAELVEPIMARISEVIEQIRRDDNYALIFDAAAGGLITADPALDLTDRVLERLRATASR
jgi:outer membrane protein